MVSMDTAPEMLVPITMKQMPLSLRSSGLLTELTRWIRALICRKSRYHLLCNRSSSTNALGGTFTAIKPNGKRVDNMIVKEAIAMKCAFGENPKRRYGDKKIATRMTNVALIREAFRKAIQYKTKVDAADGDITKMPVYDAKCEALIPVLEHKIPLKLMHTRQTISSTRSVLQKNLVLISLWSMSLKVISL